MASDVTSAIEAGRQEARQWLEHATLQGTTPVGSFGTPREMAGKYRARAIGAMGGIYGNSVEETVYPVYQLDEAGQPLDTSRFHYTLKFAPGSAAARACILVSPR